MRPCAFCLLGDSMGLLTERDISNNLSDKSRSRIPSMHLLADMQEMFLTLSRKVSRLTGSGWHDLTQELAVMADYEAYYPDEPARVRRAGDFVYLDAVLRKIKADQPATVNNDYVVFRLPEEYRPTREIVAVCQGSTMNRVTCRVMPDGNVYLCRYGTTVVQNIPLGSWLCCQFGWMI